MKSKNKMAGVKEEFVEKEKEDEDEEYKDICVYPVFSCTSSLVYRPAQTDDKFKYCEECKMKYDGECPQHGPGAFVDKVEGSNKGAGIKEFCSAAQDVADTQGVITGQKKNILANKESNCSISRDDKNACSDVEDNADAKTLEGEKPFSCDVCGTGFTRAYHLNVHKRIHTGEKPYKCDICGLAYSRFRVLTVHRRTHTGEKPYECDVCDAGFGSSSLLSRHRRIHLEVKPYKCDDCGAGFTRSNHLKVHKRSHTGERPYKCDVCGAEYSRSDHLGIHKKKHMGEQLYKCSFCGVEYSSYHTLTKHKRTHKGERERQV